MAMNEVSVESAQKHGNIHEAEAAAMVDEQMTDPFIDFGSFARAWDDPGLDSGDWFNAGFYDAVQETVGYSGFADSSSPDTLFPFRSTGDLNFTGNSADAAPHVSSNSLRTRASEANDEVPPSEDNRSGRVSQMPSPPNVPSSDDHWPFAYNPASANISQGHPIDLRSDDPLLSKHRSRHDLTVVTWERIVEFLLTQPASQSPRVILPSLPVANVFIGLFFEHFLPQAPVLHIPTVEINSLPPALIAAMIVIGAKYSQRRNTRRFSILLLDVARRSLQTAVENDTRLVRETSILYAHALMCYAGLWCGNKRAFEIAEASRGTLVSYLRRCSSPKDFSPDGTILTESRDQRWTLWATSETRKRLQWFVFMLDSQFPALLNLRGMLSLSEVATWECPCDEEYWTAPTSRIWQSLMGKALRPPAPTFATASAPIVLSGRCRGSNVERSLVPLRVNEWTAFLILLSIAARANDWSSNWALMIDLLDATAETSDSDGASEEPPNSPMQHLPKQKEEILGWSTPLDSWLTWADMSRLPRALASVVRADEPDIHRKAACYLFSEQFFPAAFYDTFIHARSIDATSRCDW